MFIMVCKSHSAVTTPDIRHIISINLEEQDVLSLTWSRTWLFVVLYFSAMASATALVPRNRVFQLCELEKEAENVCVQKIHVKKQTEKLGINGIVYTWNLKLYS